MTERDLAQIYHDVLTAKASQYTPPPPLATWEPCCTWPAFKPFAINYTRLFQISCLLVALVALWLAFRLVRSLEVKHWVRHASQPVKAAYDDFALGSGVLLSLECGWTGVKDRCYDRWMRVRYSRVGDTVVWFFNRLYFLPDRIVDTARRYWYIAPVVGGVVLWLVYARAVGQRERYVVRDTPAWVVTYNLNRRFEGSNFGMLALPELVPYEQWVSASIGGDETVTLDPLAATVTTTTTTKTMESTVRASKVRSEAEQETDYWAPRQRKTVLKADDNVWCRMCQQFHCCELPY
ncbi:hypothetical protein LTR62_005008 [Meristemomyces frigidus]|uniref:Uncharacterized protein n=1 Tax=Meristemomyces frigidus TaxID=1508187 RepID=A0AAN7YTJ2_9PEZI|nr:hypothetical protein LTR62_005008 [Meristemomyces frigidus]